MANTSSLSGQRLGAYEVGALIGAGGMGEVYRARDAKLHRDVAIKVLLPSVAGDAERLARFSREAQVLASLNHPAIAHIHGLEESDSGPFLVMELVEGPTLADRIAQGPLSIDEATAIARLIAEALEAAHERGVIHRDLKPANIKACDDGTVKVLDFGLAKALDPVSADGAPAANSPTITTPAMTLAGVILGTAAYMSPEQAKGRVVDKRTDVWAFGCVFYEMLTARRAFDGEDVTDTIAAIVRGEPDWSALPANTPPHLRLLLKRCLEKDRRVRVSDISVARFVMNEQIGEPPAPITSTPKASRRNILAAVSIGILVGAATIAATAWALRQQPLVRPARFVVTPQTETLLVQGNDRDVALAPDGSFVIYRANDSRGPRAQLAIRSFNELEGRPLAGTTNARSPAISPDGRWVAFSAMGELRKVSTAGGPATTLCQLEGAIRGISWGDDGNIVFSTSQVGPLMRVPANGGEPQAITKASPGTAHTEPFVLPGSQAVLFTSWTGSVTEQKVTVVDLRSGNEKTLVEGARSASYFGEGYLTYVVSAQDRGASEFSGMLRAVRFDADKLEVVGDSVAAVDDVGVAATGASNYAVSRAGHLVYVPAANFTTQQVSRSLVWVDRRGQETPLAAPPRAYAVARISPDGRKIALDIRDQTNDIWTWDLVRKTLTPLNRDPAQDMSPVWTSDGLRIIWSSTRHTTVPNLYAQSADGTGSVERLTTNRQNQFATAVSPDGGQVILFGASSAQHLDIFRIDLKEREHTAQTLVGSGAMELGGELSPDGRWLAYHSNESGENQVYVRPFPNVDAGRSQVSTDGGTRAAWSRRGDELFYLDSAGILTAVRVSTAGGVFSASAPSRVLQTAYYAGFSRLNLDLRGYDIAPDGQRFLMIKEAAAARGAVPLAHMVIVLNWIEELKSDLAGQ